MAMFGATLTLPGMAGIVLTVGMAVDANVIIGERIRELLKQGVSVAKSIEDGYANAMRAILDANITTLLVAVILYAYGTGLLRIRSYYLYWYFSFYVNSNFRYSWYL